MGLDFTIDNGPCYRVTGTYSDWSGEQRTFLDEDVSSEDLQAMFEEAPMHIDLCIKSVPSGPPLPDELPPTPHWAYSGFGRFRERLAKTIGIENLWLMPGFISSLYGLRLLEHYHPGVKSKNLNDAYLQELVKRAEADATPWEDIDSDLVLLINHSDCDGDLTPEQCAKVAPALREALEKMAEEPYDRFDVGHDYDVEKGYQLAECMEFCAKYERRLIFH